MVSKTKFLLPDETITMLFKKAGIENLHSITALNAGEYAAVYAVEADKSYVLKIAPKDGSDILTYEKDMMQAEVTWYALLQKHTQIRVPTVYYSDFTKEDIPAAWFIMEKIDGCHRNEFAMTNGEKEECIQQTAAMAAQMHSIHNDRFGYIQNGLHENWYLALRSMVENLLADCRKKGKRSRCGEKLLCYIDRNKQLFESVECSMVNFDIWDSNLLCSRKDGTMQMTLIDPERCFWGDRMMTFACLEMMTPLAKKKLSLQGYNAVAEQKVTATKEEKLRYAVSLALMGLIMETEKYYRYSPKHFGWYRNIAASAGLYLFAFADLK